MINDTITLNFEIEKGEPIAGQSHFSARIKLTNESKNLLCEKLGSTVQFGNLDDYFSLNPENFYIYYNQYAGRDELYVRDDNSRYLASNLPLNHNGFSIELSTDRASIVDYGFYPLAVIYNPRYYNKAEEKAFDDHGKLLPIASSMLDTFLSNTNGLTTQDIFLQIQSEIAEKEARLVREKRQAEEELDRKNEELKGLIEKGDITLFKLVKGHDIGDGRSAVILQRDGEEVILDSSKYYIAEYQHREGWEGDEYLNFVSPGSDMLVDYENLFFVLNQGSYSGFESGFYSADRSDPNNYAKYSKDRYLGGDQLSEKLLNELGKDNRQAGMLDDQPMNEEVMVESEAKSRKKRAVEEDDEEETVSNPVSTQAKSEGEKIMAVELQEDSVLQEPIQAEKNEVADKNGAWIVAAIYEKGERVDRVKELIKQGANLEVRNYRGETPLYTAIQEGKTEIAKLLVDGGASLKHVLDYSPLHLAILYKRSEIAQYLIKSGRADLDATVTVADAQCGGKTPLHLAILAKDMETFKLLIEGGADINIQDKKGITPFLETFSYGGNIAAAKYLMKHDADVNPDNKALFLFRAISVGDKELVESLIAKDADVNCKDEIGMTPLHQAAYYGSLEAIQYLLKQGAVLDSKGPAGRTPLICAISRGDIDIVKCFIKAGADVNTRMTDGYTPLHKAVIGGNLGIIQLLMDNGAKLDVRNNCGDTPLAYAKQQGQAEIVHYMDSVMSNLSHSKTISLDETNINIKYDLAGNKLDKIEKSIKDAIRDFKDAFNTSDHDIKINAYIFNTQDDFKEYLKKVGFDAGNNLNGLTKMIDLSKGNAADVYIYLDSRGNFNQHTLEHEIGHAMHFANLGLSHILPKAMHEAIANYVAGLENGRHINDYGDKEALAEIRNKDLKPDEILRNNYQGNHYYSEAEQVVKFLEHKHPDLIDNLLKSLSTYGYNDRSQGEKLVERFLAELKGYGQELKQWVKAELSSKEHSQHKGTEVNQPTIDLNNQEQHSEQQTKSRQKRATIDEDEQEKVVVTSVVDSIKDDTEEDLNHPLKIKVGEPIGVGKYKAVLQAQDQDIDNFYQNLSSQYTAGKYNYDQAMALYNKVYIQDSKLDGKPIILSEAYVTNDRLFIKDQDFGTLDNFNEMFYKSDEFI